MDSVPVNFTLKFWDEGGNPWRLPLGPDGFQSQVIDTIPVGGSRTIQTDGFFNVTFPGILNDCQTCHLPGTFDYSATPSAARGFDIGADVEQHLRRSRQSHRRLHKIGRIPFLVPGRSLPKITACHPEHARYQKGFPLSGARTACVGLRAEYSLLPPMMAPTSE
jgi:hypothetical protein